MKTYKPAKTNARILLATHDASLRASREAVLKRFGYEVVAPVGNHEITQLIREQPFDLLVLGNSLTRNAASHLATEFRQHRKGRVIEIVAYAHEAPKDHPDETVVGLDGPITLQAAIERQLQLRK